MFQLLYAMKDLGARLNMEPITETEWNVMMATLTK